MIGGLQEDFQAVRFVPVIGIKNSHPFTRCFPNSNVGCCGTSDVLFEPYKRYPWVDGDIPTNEIGCSIRSAIVSSTTTISMSFTVCRCADSIDLAIVLTPFKRQ